MSRIDSFQINNFKFFDEQDPIQLGGKHLLLFGENGSGKSSIYWSLYTLFEASVKLDVNDIKKYFKEINDSEETLINIHSTKVIEANGDEHFNSYIKVVTNDVPPINYEVSLLNTAISGNVNAIEVNQASDFINYKVLYKFQDFWNGEPMDLAPIFEGYILSYLKFSTYNIWRGGILKPISNAYEMLKEIKVGPGTTLNAKGNTIQVYKYSQENTQFNSFVQNFNQEFNDLIDFINVNAPNILKKLGYDIDFELKYTSPLCRKADSRYYYESFKVDFFITSYLGKKVNINRPQSFLNEAKITAIAIAIRLTILKKRVNQQAPDVLKFIVFDDVMISLDMNNRDMLIDFLLNPVNGFTADYQLLFLTHDKNLYDFVATKVKQWDKIDNWVYKEMYSGKNDILKKEFPVLIDSELGFIDKAKKYYDAKDYTACSIYIRKELEKIVNERLPAVLKLKIDGNFLSLQTLWGNMVKRFDALKKPITPDLIKIFEETKLMVLNPQAHFQDVSLPIYKVELDKAFKLITDLKTNYPIPEYTILLSKGMRLQFKHPTENYTFNFELISDFYIENLTGTKLVHLPNCKVIEWQFNNNVLWDFINNQVIVLKKPIEQKLNQIRDRHIANVSVPLNIDNDMFINNISIENSIWNLKDIIDKANITL